MEYEVSLQTIAWINERRTSDSLEISPDFQRRAVWLDKERASLIETICNRLPFPEVYIHVVTDQDTGSQKYIVVDGQQRTTSILMFIDGDVSLPSNAKWQGKGFRDLDAEDKRSFWDYKIVVRMLRNTNDAEIRELFRRLNTNNISLNDQELRNARYFGRFKTVSEELADDPFFQNLGLFTAREVRRMEDVEFISELLCLVIAGVQNKKDYLEDYYANYNEEFPNEVDCLYGFKAALNLLQQLLVSENQGLIKTKSNFYSLFGACVRYFREYKKTSFKNTQGVIEAITSLLTNARTFNQNEINDPIVTEYYDAVARAASDKQRRAKRENILYQIISDIEAAAQKK